MLPMNCVCVCAGKHMYVHTHAHARVHTEIYRATYIGRDTYTAMHACYYTDASILIRVTNVFNLL